MKKIILFIIFLSFIPEINAQFIRIWEKSSALGNLPTWFSASNNRERGIGYSVQNNNQRLYVISNLANPTVIILNALTGDSVGTLNTSGISGGLIALNDISTFFIYPYLDTRIFACNLTDNAATSPFKIYMWENETSAPQVIVVDSVSNFRLGDHLNIYNDIGFYKFIIAGSNTDKIIVYNSDTGNPPFTRNVITLSDGNMGNNSSADFNFFYPPVQFGGGYFVNSDGNQPKSYNSTGVLVNISEDTLISSSNNELKFYANGTLCCDNPFYLTYNYSENKAELVHSGGVAFETYYGSTPSLGSNSNPENYGDVEFTWRTIDTLYVFILGGNNGIGAYFAPGLIIPVELTSFNAETSKDGVVLTWNTATEKNNKGFEVERRQTIRQYAIGSMQNGDNKWENIGFVEGNGTTTLNHSYSFTDKNVAPGKYGYRLKQIDFDGSYSYNKEIEVTVTGPDKYYLGQNYPNPFNPSTTIKFSIPKEVQTNLTIYDILGEKVKELKNEVMRPGYYEVNFNAAALASGVYFYRIKAGDFVQTKKMLLLK